MQSPKVWHLYVLGIFFILIAGFGTYYILNDTMLSTFLPSPNQPHPSICICNFNATRAFGYIQDQVNFGYRYPGSIGINETRQFIVSELHLWGWKVFFDNFTFQNYSISNILALPINATPSTLNDTILFGAHYDTRKVADQDPIIANQNTPVMGANDGASGVAALLEMAQIYRNSTNIGLLFIDAEDQGDGGMSGWNWLEGSSHFANNTILQQFFPDGASSIKYFVLYDMIADKNLDIYREGNSDTTLTDQIFSTAGQLGYSTYFINQYRYTIIDDHVPFKNLGIPTVDLIDFDYTDSNGNNLHHTAHDTINNVSAASLGIVGQTVERWLQNLDIWSISS